MPCPGIRARHGHGMRIDLNAELGHRSEGVWVQAEAELWPLVSSVAVPCGAHAGDPSSLLGALAQAAARGVAVGASLGYRDGGSGDRFVDYSADDLTADLLFQLGGLDALAVTGDQRLRFVRAGGALQEAAHADRSHAWAILNAVLDFDASLTVLGRPGSRLLELAERHGLSTAVEFHPHRMPAPGGGLGAVIEDAGLAAERAVAAVRRGAVDTIWLPCGSRAERALAQAVHAALVEAGCAVEPLEAGQPPEVADTAGIGRRAG